MDAQTAQQISTLAAEVETGLRAHADPDYVAGTIAARHPGKPVLGVRIPLLRATVKSGLRSAGITARDPNPAVVFGAADALWHGQLHEGELAAAMMLRVRALVMPAAMITAWAPLLDNWLSVDELGGVVGVSLCADPALLGRLAGLAVSESVWQRRLYVVSLIRPVKAGLNVGEVAGLADLLREKDPAVRKACVWLINEAIKARGPAAAAQFRRLVPTDEPKPVVRILDAALT
ncbi:DNA alkylation repair protein [Nocardia sp. NPDC048505]|uniref:DNA alkylation repair protein n=1 Tax=Nocardia sp. NPDC048505 TaxID=3155756 RepID=UPI0034045835